MPRTRDNRNGLKSFGLLGLLAVGVFTYSGCASPQRRRQQYVTAHPELSTEAKKDILSGTIWVGMTPDQARASWGDPCEINHSGGINGSRDQWVYGQINPNTMTGPIMPVTCAGKPYLYFDDGKLTSWQN